MSVNEIEEKTEKANKEKKPTEEKKEGSVKKVLKKTPSLMKKPAKFVGQILASGAKTIGSFLLIIIFFSLIGGLFSGPLGTSSSRETVLFGEGPEKILVVPLQGVILNQPQPFSGSTGTIIPESVRQSLKHAEEDEHIKAVIFDLESPGGSAVASDRIYALIADFRKRTGKPVVSLMGDVAASGGYYISAATNKIIANPSTITGSIGVIASTLNVEELMGKLGIKEEVFKKGKYKDILSSTRGITEGEKEIIDSLLEDSYQQFITRIVEGRNMSRSRIQSLASGRVFSGVQAKEVGLVDALGNLEEAVVSAKQLAGIKEAQVVRIETGGILEQLFSGISLGWLNRILAQPTLPRIWYLMQ